MMLRRVDPMSCANVLAFIQMVIGLLTGLAVAFLSLLPVEAITKELPWMRFGLAAIVLAPLLQGLSGFVTGYLGARLYNAAAVRFGGIRIELDAAPIPSTQTVPVP
jgi:hypothetical protein